jgi:hypothetical protein
VQPLARTKPQPLEPVAQAAQPQPAVELPELGAAEVVPGQPAELQPERAVQQVQAAELLAAAERRVFPQPAARGSAEPAEQAEPKQVSLVLRQREAWPQPEELQAALAVVAAGPAALVAADAPPLPSVA